MIRSVKCDESVVNHFTEEFSSEEALVKEFENLFKGMGVGNLRIEREVDCGFGIADAVFFECKTLTEKRLSLAEVSPSWAYALRSLPYRKNFDVDYLAQISGTSVSSAKKELVLFERGGFCRAKTGGIWIKHRQPELLSKNVISFEAKLKDWKRALWQASRYKTFSNQVWVVLDHRHINPAMKNLHSFARFNVGLASISVNQNFIVHYCPQKEEHKSNISLWRANALLAKRLLC